MIQNSGEWLRYCKWQSSWTTAYSNTDFGAKINCQFRCIIPFLPQLPHKCLQSIAKEGRKYGVGLLLITQRPSELDETVLSQCGTIIALRMNNSKDRSHIRSAIQDELQTMVDLLPSLRTGEAIISGEGVKIPSRVQFYKLSNAPKGTDPVVSEKWMEKKDISVDDYNRLLTLWRNQNLKEKSE